MGHNEIFYRSYYEKSMGKVALAVSSVLPTISAVTGLTAHHCG